MIICYTKTKKLQPSPEPRDCGSGLCFQSIFYFRIFYVFCLKSRLHVVHLCSKLILLLIKTFCKTTWSMFRRPTLKTSINLITQPSQRLKIKNQSCVYPYEPESFIPFDQYLGMMVYTFKITCGSWIFQRFYCATNNDPEWNQRTTW